MLGIVLALVVNSAVAFDEKDLRKFKALGSCEGCDLSKLNWKGVNLRGINFKNTNLSDGNFRNADLRNAFLINVDLSGADLRGANLEGSKLWQVNLTKANMSTTRLKGADIKNPVYCDTEMPWGVERENPSKVALREIFGLRHGSCMTTREIMERQKAAKVKRTTEEEPEKHKPSWFQQDMKKKFEKY